VVAVCLDVLGLGSVAVSIVVQVDRGIVLTSVVVGYGMVVV
jgi:hypothetical protein